MPWIKGQGYDVLKQNHAQSCGYCCIGMTAGLGKTGGVKVM